MNDRQTLRVLLAIESAGGGSGRHVLDLAAGLANEGIDVTLFYSPVRADGWFIEEARALDGVTLEEIEIHRAPGVSDFIAAIRLRRYVARHGPFDIVHGHSAKAGAIARLAMFASKTASVYTPHAFITLDPQLGRLSRTAYTVAERILAWLGSGIICVSEEERKHARSLGIAARRLFVVNNGLAPLPPGERDAVRDRWGLTADDVCMGFVGRVSEQKAVHRLVQVLARLRSDHDRLWLVIVGTGPLLESVRTLAKELQVADRVIFYGAGHGSALMAGFDIFTLSSRYEAFPYVYVEALARGLPILTTRVGGADAVVSEGGNGFVIEQGEKLIEDFARRVSELCRDPGRRNEMGRRSAERAPRFSIENMVRQTIEVYRGILGSQ